MYGAICGDMMTGRDGGTWTGATVMTMAVADGLIRADKDASAEKIHEEVVKSMRMWGRSYPDAGYGKSFYRWLFQEEDAPYGSFGDGAAMRVSAAGWLYDTLERTREVARITAEATHNHPEGVKGAECVAAVIFLARTGKPKEEIRRYVEKEFHYALNRTPDELRRHHGHTGSAQDALPKALTALFAAADYESTVKTAAAPGGDARTIAAIAGSMAEALYGIPVLLMAAKKEHLDPAMLDVLAKFDAILGRNENQDAADVYENNRFLAEAVEDLYKEDGEKSLLPLANVLLALALNDGAAPIPMVDENHVLEGFDTEALVAGKPFSFGKDLKLTICTMTDGDGKQWIPLFTDMKELQKQPTAEFVITMPIRSILNSGLRSDRAEGVVINPFGKPYALKKEFLKLIVDEADRQAPQEE